MPRLSHVLFCLIRVSPPPLPSLLPSFPYPVSNFTSDWRVFFCLITVSWVATGIAFLLIKCLSLSFDSLFPFQSHLFVLALAVQMAAGGGGFGEDTNLNSTEPSTIFPEIRNRPDCNKSEQRYHPNFQSPVWMLDKINFKNWHDSKAQVIGTGSEIPDCLCTQE